VPRLRSWLLTLGALGALGAHAAAIDKTPAADAALADDAFGFRLLNAVQGVAPAENVVLSPVSASLALSMVLNGATGQTREEMLGALSLEGRELDAINAANAALIKIIRTPTESVTLSVAESLWINNRLATLRPEYRAQMQASYDAEVSELDLAAPAAASRINAWASQKTQGRVAKILDRTDAADLLLLLNAVYFKGQWTHKFDKTLTETRDFALVGGQVKQVPRMAQSGRFEYFETSDLQAIRLPFGDGDLAMEVLLPAKSSSLGALEKNLSPEHWKEWRGHFAFRAGRIELPRFELKAKYRLNDSLQKLGMIRAFEPRTSELTGMLAAPGGAGSGRFFISSVLQSVFWKTDEEGSEAAAVTSVTVQAAAVVRAPPPFQMIVDRPFFCAIEDRRSGALVFVGAIFDPAG
jgi:serine protease inhibitor